METPNDLSSLLATLDCFKHWTIKTINRTATTRAYECQIWGLGRRVSCQARSPHDAIRKAIAKLKDADKPRFKIVRGA